MYKIPKIHSTIDHREPKNQVLRAHVDKLIDEKRDPLISAILASAEHISEALDNAVLDAADRILSYLETRFKRTPIV